MVVVVVMMVLFGEIGEEEEVEGESEKRNMLKEYNKSVL